MTTIEFQFELINLQKKLMIFAYKLTLDMDNARDLVQETNLRALNHREKFASNTNLSAWTYTIMKNTFINDYRYNFKRNAISKPIKETFPALLTHSDRANNPDSIYMSKELEDTIDSLHNNLKTPFKMFFEGYKYHEIAEILGIKVGTVKSRIFLARKKLMARVNEYNNAWV
jgi:RNA polymerase sigma factor (sigma-70 family)